MNKKMYRSKMALNGDTNLSIALFLNITPQRNSAKVNGTKGAEYSCGEIIKIKKRWKLTPQEVDAIFFEEEVSC